MIRDMFYVAQLFGIIALIVLMISFQNNKKETLLKYQIFSSLLFALQYLFLNAISGCLMNIMTMVRNIIYKKFNDRIPIKYLILVIICMIILSAFSYNGLISLLPTLAVILYSIALWQKNLTITRIIEIISCSLFIIYNIKVLAISGLVSTFIEMFSAIIAIYKFDIKKSKTDTRKFKN